MSVVQLKPTEVATELKPINHEAINALIQMLDLTSTDPTRLCLGYVRIEPTASGAKLVATNGHMLGQYSVECLGLASLPGVHYLHRENLKALKQIKKDLKFMDVPLSVIDGKLVIGKLGLSQLVILERELAMEYPDYQAIIPKVSDDQFRIGVNAEYLLALANSLKTEGRFSHIEIILPKDRLAAISVRVGQNTGVVMPVRI